MLVRECSVTGPAREMVWIRIQKLRENLLFRVKFEAACSTLLRTIEMQAVPPPEGVSKEEYDSSVMQRFGECLRAVQAVVNMSLGQVAEPPAAPQKPSLKIIRDGNQPGSSS